MKQICSMAHKALSTLALIISLALAPVLLAPLSTGEGAVLLFLNRSGDPLLQGLCTCCSLAWNLFLHLAKLLLNHIVLQGCLYYPPQTRLSFLVMCSYSNFLCGIHHSVMFKGLFDYYHFCFSRPEMGRLWSQTISGPPPVLYNRQI